MIMQRIKCVMSYDGTNFSGFQIQPKQRTIHGEIERALKKVHKGRMIRIQSSGRTDAGVHAKGQVFHFDTDLPLESYEWKKILNALLPDDTYVHTVSAVCDEFHARYSAKEKEYRYYVYNHPERCVFKNNYSHFYPYELNVEAMQVACQSFEGTHDFTTFSSAKSSVKGDKIRTLYEVSCTEEGPYIMFKLRGSGFLYTMARTIVGALLDVGNNRLASETIDQLFAEKDRTRVGKAAPSEGLYLWEVIY